MRLRCCYDICCCCDSFLLLWPFVRYPSLSGRRVFLLTSFLLPPPRTYIHKRDLLRAPSTLLATSCGFIPLPLHVRPRFHPPMPSSSPTASPSVVVVVDTDTVPSSVKGARTESSRTVVFLVQAIIALAVPILRLCCDFIMCKCSVCLLPSVACLLPCVHVSVRRAIVMSTAGRGYMCPSSAVGGSGAAGTLGKSEKMWAELRT